jgi:hypothetical protein
VRLNLETGEQVALLNNTDFYNLKLTFQISDSDRYLLFTPDSWQAYDLAVLDLQTWKTRTVKLESAGEIDLNYAVLSPDEEKIVLPLFKQQQPDANDYRVDALLLIDLATGHQRLLVSDLKPEEELYPVRFEDAQAVLLSNERIETWQSQQTVELWRFHLDTWGLEKVDP